MEGGKEKEIQEIARAITLLILDVDGVLTDGRIVLDEQGNELKFFHVRDGHGIKMAQREGIEVAIITGRSSRVVERRARELGIGMVHQGAVRKLEAYREVLKAAGRTDRETAYVGDDIVDVPVMVRVGLPIAVADASPEARRYARLVTTREAGRGAVREVTDFLLKARGRWDDIVEAYAQV